MCGKRKTGEKGKPKHGGKEDPNEQFQFRLHILLAHRQLILGGEAMYEIPLMGFK